MALRENPTQSEVVKAIRELQESGGVSGVTSVNGKTGEVVITASDLDVYTKSEIDTTLENYVTTNTSQVISGEKTFSSKITSTEYKLLNNSFPSGINTITTGLITLNGQIYTCQQFGDYSVPIKLWGSNTRPFYQQLQNEIKEVALLDDVPKVIFRRWR